RPCRRPCTSLTPLLSPLFPPKEPTRRAPAQESPVYQKSPGIVTKNTVMGTGPRLSSRARSRRKSGACPHVSFHRGSSELQIAIDEVVLLQTAQPLADLARPDCPHAVHSLQIALGGPHDRVQGAQVADDPADHLLRQARDVGQDPVAAGLDR